MAGTCGYAPPVLTFMTGRGTVSPALRAAVQKLEHGQSHEFGFKWIRKGSLSPLAWVAVYSVGHDYRSPPMLSRMVIEHQPEWVLARHSNVTLHSRANNSRSQIETGPRHRGPVISTIPDK